ncbi:MAG: hypothetical protein ACE5K9_05835 [Candidatus Methylomirabilales bacterium]
MKLSYTIFIWAFILLYGSLSLAIPTPLYAEPQRTMVNLRGDEVLVPADVPAKKDYVLQRVMSVDDRLIVFLYRDPKFGRPVDYAETYNLMGELLEVAWYQPTAGVKRARDINLGKSEANGPARILRIVQEFPEIDPQPGR